MDLQSLDLKAEDDYYAAKQRKAAELYLDANIDHCILQWTIENNAFLKLYESPNVTLDVLSTKWNVRFRSFYENNQNKIGIRLNRSNEDDGPSNVGVTYKPGLIIQEEKVWFEERRKITFSKGTYDEVEVQFDMQEHCKQLGDSFAVLCEMYVYKIDDFSSKHDFAEDSYDLVELSCNLAQMINTDFSDVVLQCGNLQLHLNKCILAARSITFANLLKHNKSCIPVLNAYFDHIFNIVMYIYTGNFNMVLRHGMICIGLYECAVSYSIPTLVDILTPKQIHARTCIMTEKMDITWDIERILYSSPESKSWISPMFSIGKLNAHPWILELYTDSKDPDYFELNLETSDADHYISGIQISILNKDGIVLHSVTGNIADLEKCFTVPKFLLKQALFMDTGVIHDDMMTINCKVTYIHFQYFLYNVSCKITSDCGINFSLVSLSKDLAKMFYKQIFSNAIMVSDREMFPVHKEILSQRSPTLNRLLKQTQKAKCVIGITDVSPRILAALLHYVYTGQLVKKDVHFTIELYEAAVVYAIRVLQVQCARRLISLLDIFCLFQIVKTAFVYDDKYLMSNCLQYSLNNVATVVKSEEWKKFVESRSEVSIKLTTWFLNKIENEMQVEM